VFFAGGIGITPTRSILHFAIRKGVAHRLHLLARFLPELHGPVYYVSGPSGLVTGMTNLLSHCGVSEDDIKTEEFGDYSPAKA
jgi:ferredoxin-NADP reductase